MSLSSTVCVPERSKGDQIEEERCLEQPERKVLAAVYYCLLNMVSGFMVNSKHIFN